MSTIFWKNLLKCLPTTPATSHHPFPSQQDHSPPLLPSPSTTTIMINNFNSLRELSSASASASTSKSLTTNCSSFSSSSSLDSDADADSPPDFASVFASQRFFFPSPGRSNSIIDTSPPETPLDGGVAVRKYSPDPYTDFKRSMQEMIEARGVKDVRADWDYLHELLSCYLTLNPKHTHKFIISAFADIIVSLLLSSSSSPESVAHRNPEWRRRHNVSRNWLV